MDAKPPVRHRRTLRAWRRLPLGRRIAAAGVALLLSGGGVAGLHSALAGETPQPKPVAGSATKSVTLVTGDSVSVTRLAGRSDSAAVLGRRPGVSYQVMSRDGHAIVLPSDAMALVAAKVVDERLFDVTALVDLGYDDASTDQLPLVVDADVSAPAPKGASDVKDLPRLRAKTMTVPKRQAAEFWAAAVAGSGNHRTSLTQGMRRLSLAGQLQPADVRSLGQINAATVAQPSGLTGAGVTVAVLDSGLDMSHPDSKDLHVVAAKDFTGGSEGEGTDDMSGHGTAVAGVLGGSGAASDGAYRGVAPGVSLLVGKVCLADGCNELAVLEATEWAVEHGARIVNISIGCGTHCPRNNPSSTARKIDELAATAPNTLFVVSAGNESEDWNAGGGSAADAALAVGSVNPNDVVSDFSNRGPRTYDSAVKPDITAPGEDVGAALARHGSYAALPANASYTAFGGTSCAAPHVAGAAALLAQQHPDWNAARIKATLMSTSKRLPNASLYAGGTGRLDVGRATTQQVTAEAGSISFGYHQWPHTTEPQAKKQVTYRNDSDAAVTLNLSLAVTDSSGKGATSGAFGVDQPSVTVAAHGTATATVTLDPAKAGAGLFGGWLTGVSADGSIVVNTGVGADLEEEQYTVTVRAVTRDGTPATSCDASVESYRRTDDGYLDVFTSGIRRTYGACADENGVITFRTRPGTLVAVTTIYSSAGAPNTYEYSAIAMPALDIHADTTVVADARTAKPVTVAVADDPGARRQYYQAGWTLGRHAPSGYLYLDTSASLGTATVGATSSDFTFYAHATWQTPAFTARVTGGDEVPLERHPFGGQLPGDRHLPVVDQRAAAPENLAKATFAGTAVLVSTLVADPVTGIELPSQERFEAVVAALEKTGAAAAIVVTPVELRLARKTPLPVLTAQPRLADTLAGMLHERGTLAIDTRTEPGGPRRYELVFSEAGKLPTGASYRVKRADLARVTARYHHAGDQVPAVAHAVPVLPDGQTLGAPALQLWLPQEITTYYTATNISWRNEVTVGDPAGAFFAERRRERPRSYQAGREYRVDWLAAPTSLRMAAPSWNDPEGSGVLWVIRSDDQIILVEPVLADPNADLSGFAAHSGGTVTLLRDGVEVGRSEGFRRINVDAATATYQLRAEIRRASPPFVTLATSIRADWVFRSGHVDGAADLPLLDLDYQVPVDLANSVPAGRPTTFTVTVGRAKGSTDVAVRSVTARVSYDGGTTWTSASVKQQGQRWQVTTPVPATAAETASLEVAAVDETGDSITEVITDAYRLRR